MKNFMRATLLAVGLIVAFSASGNAQISRQYKAHIPFDFTIGNKEVKSGDYLIRPADGVSNQRGVILQELSTGKARLIGQALISSNVSNKQGSLTFVKSGDAWILRDVMTDGFELNLKVNSNDAPNIAAVKKTEKTKTVLVGQ